MVFILDLRMRLEYLIEKEGTLECVEVIGLWKQYVDGFRVERCVWFFFCNL